MTLNLEGVSPMDSAALGQLVQLFSRVNRKAAT
jgi:anti-anti-sigma regulatory factor